jgi:putative nucleotide binding protein
VGTLEDYAHILDFLPQGLTAERQFKREPLAYALGEIEFKLFELVPKPNLQIGIGERVYIGKEADKRDRIAHVKRRVSYEELTAAAHSELPFVVQDVVKQNEARFTQFYNDAQAITTRFHMLELLPGLGKKTMWAIIEERKKGPFKSFVDIATRIPSFKHPEKVIAKRIEMELSDPTQKYHIFVSR